MAGENDGLPGLVLDRYDGTLVLKLYTAAWLPHLPVLTQTGHPAGRVFGSIPGDGISEVDFDVPPPRQLKVGCSQVGEYKRGGQFRRMD